MALSLQNGSRERNGTVYRRFDVKVKFVLTMDDLLVDDKTIDQLILDWESDMDQGEILELSHKWITSKNFLTQRMVGLMRVGESSLTIEPLEEEEQEHHDQF